MHDWQPVGDQLFQPPRTFIKVRKQLLLIRRVRDCGRQRAASIIKQCFDELAHYTAGNVCLYLTAVYDHYPASCPDFPFDCASEFKILEHVDELYGTLGDAASPVFPKTGLSFAFVRDRRTRTVNLGLDSLAKIYVLRASRRYHHEKGDKFSDDCIYHGE